MLALPIAARFARDAVARKVHGDPDRRPHAAPRRGVERRLMLDSARTPHTGYLARARRPVRRRTAATLRGLADRLDPGPAPS